MSKRMMIYRYDELVGQSDLASVRIKDTETSTPKPEDPADTDNVGDGSTVRTTKHDTDTDTDTNADSRRQTSGNCTSIVITGIYSIKCAESTQTETQRRASEPTAIEIPQSSPSKTEPKSMTTNSKIPLLPSGGIITLFGILIGVLHRIQCSNQMVGRPTDYMPHETPY